MSDKLYLGQPRTAREVDANSFSGAFGEYRADAAAVIGAASSDLTYWQDSVPPRESNLPFYDSVTGYKFIAQGNWHLIGALNMRFTWAIAPTVGDTVRVIVISSYNDPDTWISECEMAVGNGDMAMSLAIGDFLPTGEDWQVHVFNNTDQDLTLYGKMTVYRIG